MSQPCFVGGAQPAISPTGATLAPMPGLVFGTMMKLGCVLTIINGGFSASCFVHTRLRTSRSPRFYPPHCYQCFTGPGSSVHPCESVSHSPIVFSQCASGSPNRSGFMVPMAATSIRSVGLPWVRRTASPYTRPAPYRFVSLRPPWLSLDIGIHLLKSARPTPLYHIAGLLFATYTGSTSWCRRRRPAPRDITATAVALLVSLFRPER